MKYDSKGRELPDATPVEIPAGMGRPESLVETIRRMVRNEISQRVVQAGGESFDEAFDFEVDEDGVEIADTQYTLLGSEEDGVGYEERLGYEGGERGQVGEVRAGDAGSSEGGSSEEEHPDGGASIAQSGGFVGHSGDLSGKPVAGAGSGAPSKQGVKGASAKRAPGKA